MSQVSCLGSCLMVYCTQKSNASPSTHHVLWIWDDPRITMPFARGALAGNTMVWKDEAVASAIRKKCSQSNQPNIMIEQSFLWKHDLQCSTFACMISKSCIYENDNHLKIHQSLNSCYPILLRFFMWLLSLSLSLPPSLPPSLSPLPASLPPSLTPSLPPPIPPSLPPSIPPSLPPSLPPSRPPFPSLPTYINILSLSHWLRHILGHRFWTTKLANWLVTLGPTQHFLWLWFNVLVMLSFK